MGFYSFLVDHFEEFRSDASKKRVDALLQVVWSNRQIFPEHVVTTTDSNESYDLLAAQQDEVYD